MADRAAHHLRDDGDSELRLSATPLTPAKGALRALATDRPPEILFPPQGAELWAGKVDGRAPRPFVLAGRGSGALNWFIDGEPAPVDDAGAPVWRPDRPGFYQVTAVDGAGRSSRVRVRVLTEDPA
jgi:penicillin-binding protein 1C